MNIKEAAIQIKNAMRVYFAKDQFGNYRIPPEKQRPIFLVGAPGIGKTAIMEQIADELGVGLISYSMTHHTRQSALGLPFITTKQYGGRDYTVSEYTMSEIIAAVYDYIECTGKKEGILFLDEINCVSETLTPAMLQFLQYKVFGMHQVPNGWIVVTAGNPPEYNRAVREFDIATLDRLKRIDVEPDYTVWREYAMEKGVHPSVIHYLDVRPDDFYSIETTAAGKSYVTARGWEDLSQMLLLYEEEDLAVTQELVGQYLQNKRIAADFTDSYALYARFRSLYAPEEILGGSFTKDAVRKAAGATVEEKLSILGGLLSAVTAKLTAAFETQEAAAAAVSEIRAFVKNQPDALNALTIHLTEKKNALFEKSSHRAISVSEEKRENAVIAVLEGVAKNLTENDLSACVSLLGDKTRQTMENASKCLENTILFLYEAFGEGREMTLFTSGICENRACSRFLRVFGCEIFFAHAVNPGARHDAITRQIEELKQTS